MKQASKNKSKGKSKNKKKSKKKYGTSNLERDFAKEFLDEIKVKYVYQFEAKEIGRYYDFYLPDDNLIIEVDGDYYHSYNIDYKDMTPMQKKNKYVDDLKNNWALRNGIPILRIWEHDIRNNKDKVMEEIKKMIKKSKEKIDINKKKRKIIY